MPARKSSPKGSRKATGVKRLKATEGPVFPLELIYPRPVKLRSSKKLSGGKITRVWGDFDDASSDIDLSKVPRMPNPMPDNIISLLKLAGEATWLTVPLAPYIYLLIKSWFEGRNSRKLKIKKGDVEVEFQGVWSERNFQKAFDRFRKMTKELNEDDIQVIENGKVIEHGKAPAFKVKQADIERAREMQSGKVKAKAPTKGKAKGERK
jgi:hypothetical protein